MNIISKELFVSAINDVKANEKYTNELNEFYEKHDVDGYLIQPDCSVTVIQLLHEIFGRADDGEWISYFCFELDFGAKYKPGMIYDDKGNIIDLSSSEKLYDFLLENLSY